MIRKPKVLLLIGLALIGAGFWLLLPQNFDDGYMNASYPTNTTATIAESKPNFLGWGTLLLGFLTLGSSHYFKLREARRADRSEAREIDRSRRPKDDTH